MKTAHASGDARDRFECHIRPGRAGELEAAKRRHAQRKRRSAASRASRAADGQAAGLREQFHQDDGGHDRLSGEMSLKEPVVGMRDAQCNAPIHQV